MSTVALNTDDLLTIAFALRAYEEAESVDTAESARAAELADLIDQGRVAVLADRSGRGAADLTFRPDDSEAAR